MCNIKHASVFLAELRRKVPVNDDDLIPANLPRQAHRKEFFALLATKVGTKTWGPDGTFSYIGKPEENSPRLFPVFLGR